MGAVMGGNKDETERLAIKSVIGKEAKKQADKKKEKHKKCQKEGKRQYERTLHKQGVPIPGKPIAGCAGAAAGVAAGVAGMPAVMPNAAANMGIMNPMAVAQVPAMPVMNNGAQNMPNMMGN